jgi:hypothetical protein
MYGVYVSNVSEGHRIYSEKLLPEVCPQLSPECPFLATYGFELVLFSVSHMPGCTGIS